MKTRKHEILLSTRKIQRSNASQTNLIELIIFLLFFIEIFIRVLHFDFLQFDLCPPKPCSRYGGEV